MGVCVGVVVARWVGGWKLMGGVSFQQNVIVPLVASWATVWKAASSYPVSLLIFFQV